MTLQPQKEVSEPEFFDTKSEAEGNFGITFHWSSKQCHFPWIMYEAFIRTSDEDFEMHFGRFLVRGRVSAGSIYPMNELLKAIEQRFVYAIWDLPEEGFSFEVFLIGRDEDGNTIETKI